MGGCYTRVGVKRDGVPACLKCKDSKSSCVRLQLYRVSQKSSLKLRVSVERAIPRRKVHWHLSVRCAVLEISKNYTKRHSDAFMTIDILRTAARRKKWLRTFLFGITRSIPSRQFPASLFGHPLYKHESGIYLFFSSGASTLFRCSRTLRMRLFIILRRPELYFPFRQEYVCSTSWRTMYTRD